MNSKKPGPADTNVPSQARHLGGVTSTVLISAAGNVLEVSGSALKLWRPLNADCLIGRKVEDLLSDESATHLKEAMRNRSAWEGTLEASLPDGGACLVMASLDPLIGKSEFDAWSLLLAPLDADILVQKQHILSLAGLAVVSTNSHGTIIQASASGCEMFGYEVGELIGTPIHLLFPPALRDRHADHIRRFTTDEAVNIKMGTRSELSGYRKDGSIFPVEASISKFKLGTEWVLFAVIQDISRCKRAQDDLIWRATHDALTELPNRTLIMERLSRSLSHSMRDDKALALLFIDLDGFKLVNDTHGHSVGDALLKHVADRILKLIRPGDTLGRLAGDQFLLLCEHIADPVAVSSLADRLLESLQQPVQIDGIQVRASASIGIALGHGDERNIGSDALLREADIAMNAVKERGRNGWQFFNVSLQTQANLRSSINAGLRSALENNEFTLLSQPIISAQGGRIAGAELLLRWQRAEGPVSPAEFIPIAESNGTIHPIGEWVFSEACRLESSWRARFGETAPYVSVNVSTRQLDDPQLPAKFFRLLQFYDTDPSRIVLEITETSLMFDPAHCLKVLKELADFGLRAAVDDFGTGYSSLVQLLRLPIDTLKIDREFIDGLEKRPENRAVTSAVIKLGHSLQLKIVAEGVENAAQLSELQTLGCDFVQGYYFHRPLAQQVFLDVFHEEHSTRSVFFDKAIHYLIYVSKTTEPHGDASLNALLEECRPINRDNGITGVLLSQGDYFMQLLEGSEEDVQLTFDRIRADPRHDNVRVVARGYQQTRMFPHWEMGQREIRQDAQSLSADSHIMPKIHFMDLVDNPRACFAFISAYASSAESA